MRSLFLLTISFLILQDMSAQDWWSKTKKQSVPPDYSSTTLLIEKFKNMKADEAPAQAYLDKDKNAEHPLIVKTNENLEVYNEELKEICKSYKHSYELASEKKCGDTLKFPYDSAKYVLKHEVYLRKFQKDGVNDYFYTYLFYFYDRKAKRAYPLIYLFEEKRLKSLEVLISYLNQP